MYVPSGHDGRGSAGRFTHEHRHRRGGIAMKQLPVYNWTYISIDSAQVLGITWKTSRAYNFVTCTNSIRTQFFVVVFRSSIFVLNATLTSQPLDQHILKRKVISPLVIKIITQSILCSWSQKSIDRVSSSRGVCHARVTNIFSIDLLASHSRPLGHWFGPTNSHFELRSTIIINQLSHYHYCVPTSSLVQLSYITICMKTKADTPKN